MERNLQILFSSKCLKKIFLNEYVMRGVFVLHL